MLSQNEPSDGQFGPETESAVKSFQSSKGLLVDGIVGTKTWSALESKHVEAYLPYKDKFGPFDLDRIVATIPQTYRSYRDFGKKSARMRFKPFHRAIFRSIWSRSPQDKGLLPFNTL